MHLQWLTLDFVETLNLRCVPQQVIPSIADQKCQGIYHSYLLLEEASTIILLNETENTNANGQVIDFLKKNKQTLFFVWGSPVGNEKEMPSDW